MRVIPFSRHFPKGHPKAGQPTWFAESILNAIMRTSDGVLNINNIMLDMRDFVNDFQLIANERQKHHTIRAGSRWKAGDMASLRVWSDKPYRSKQIEFAQVEVKRVWEIEIFEDHLFIEGFNIGPFHPLLDWVKLIAQNDGLTPIDFYDWFSIQPKKKENIFRGQIICWSQKINYTP